MQVCVPIVEDRGLQSHVCEHFGSAPAFILVDAASREFRVLVNQHAQHGHGGCAPVTDLLSHGIDVLVVGGIGRGALEKVQRAGVQALRAAHTTVSETVEACVAGRLAPISLQSACAGHHGHHGGHVPTGELA